MEFGNNYENFLQIQIDRIVTILPWERYHFKSGRDSRATLWLQVCFHYSIFWCFYVDNGQYKDLFCHC